MMLLDPKKPILIPRLPWLAWLGQAARYGLVLAMGVALGIAIQQFRQGALGYMALTVLGYVLTTGWAGFSKWLDNEKLKRLEIYAPNSVAQLKGPKPDGSQ